MSLEVVWPQTFWRSQANKAKSVEKKDSDETRSRTRSSTHLHWRVCCHLLPEQIDPIEPRLLHRSKSKKVKQVFFKYSDFLSKDLFQPIHWRLRSRLLSNRFGRKSSLNLVKMASEVKKREEIGNWPIELFLSSSFSSRVSFLLVSCCVTFSIPKYFSIVVIAKIRKTHIIHP